MNTKAQGIIYEEKAKEYLLSKGYEIIAQNLNYARIGELDIVCRDGKKIIIVEVKYRTDNDFGHPLEAITKYKISRILKATNLFLREYRPKYNEIRFDVVYFLGDVMEHIENAFYGYWH